MDNPIKFHLKKMKEKSETHHSVTHTTIDFRRIFKGRKIPLVTLDERWLSLFPEEEMTDAMISLRNAMNQLLKSQGKAVDTIKGYKRYKSQLMQEIVSNMEVDESPIGRLKVRKLEKNQKLIQDLNTQLLQMEDELAAIPYQIRDTNEQLMGESTNICYQRLVKNTKKNKELKQEIAQLERELSGIKAEQTELERKNREIYLYLHDMLGTENMKLIDDSLDKSE